MAHISAHPAPAGVAVPGIGAVPNHNDHVRGGRIAGFTVALAGTVVLAGTGTLSGCTGSSPAAEPPSPTPAADPGSPADRLAGLVALAADRHYTASYTYTPSGGSARTVTVTTARDGSWRVDVPRGALGGGRDVTVAGTRNGVYQCGLTEPPSCVRVAEPGGSVPARYDPRVERLFTVWIGRLGNRNAALSVDTSKPLAKDSGHCFSVEPTAASLSAPVPSGVYCLATDGTVTGASLGLGTVTLLGRPAAAPGSVTLPGPVTGGSAVPTRSPSPSPTPSGRTRSPASTSASASAEKSLIRHGQLRPHHRGDPGPARRSGTRHVATMRRY